MPLLTTAQKKHLLKRALANPLFLGAVARWLRRQARSAGDAYVPEALGWGAGELRDAAARRRPVVWCNVTVPSELIYGLGGIPVMPEMVAGFAAAWRGSPGLLAAADACGFSADLCSFHRCAVGLGLEGWLPRPDAVVACNLFCDGAKKFLRYLSHRQHVPFFLIDVPYRDGPEAIQHTASSLQEVAQGLEEATRGRLSLRHLPHALELSNQARSYYLQAADLRRSRPAPWRGSEALSYAAVFFMAFGSAGGVRIYRSLAEALQHRTSHGQAAVPQERHRLLWLHFRPFYARELTDFLEVERGGVIAAEEMSYLWWDELDPGDPFTSLARKLTSHFLWGPTADRNRGRVATMLYLAQEYGVDGVIHYSHWGCRQATGSVDLLRQACRRAGLPFLNLEGDCIDPRNGAEGQVRTRLEAFLESLASRR